MTGTGTAGLFKDNEHFDELETADNHIMCHDLFSATESQKSAGKSWSCERFVFHWCCLPVAELRKRWHLSSSSSSSCRTLPPHLLPAAPRASDSRVLLSEMASPEAAAAA
ncbi:hypothetical protein JOB18_037187 [Solea senegalensis]|uniref:Uncharacterized protein n=1 Tax=Solea senegalensis TaxID=28829 RepID=A0AAV6RW83_SOLSE|nr:hypothetical protein JOB18_037187 [Solea senegalensis]